VTVQSGDVVQYQFLLFLSSSLSSLGILSEAKGGINQEDSGCPSSRRKSHTATEYGMAFIQLIQYPYYY
jgi:hypothetical protein